MTEIWEFPTGNYSIFVLVGVVCIIIFITSYLGYATDVEETCNVSEVLYIQRDILPLDPIYVVTLKIVECFVTSGSTDIILRLKGSIKNGPLLLFRDFEGRIEDRSTINIGFSVPFQLGHLISVEIAADNSRLDEGFSVFSFSDLYVRKLPRKSATLANSNTRDMLEKGGTPFEALSSCLRTWTSTGTLLSSKGVRIVGVRTHRDGRVRTVRAREAPIELPLVEESARIKTATKIGFRPLHYIWSQLRSWHDEWSDYSQLDLHMTMCLDLLATLVSVSCCFAFGVERFIGGYFIADSLGRLAGVSAETAALTIEEFNAPVMVQDLKSSIIPLIVIAYTAIIASTFVIPLSLIWSRLFRMIGGKGFEDALDLAQTTSHERRRLSSWPKGRRGIPRFSARQRKCSSMIKDEIIEGSSIILRTLEVKNTYTASSTSTTRKLTMEPLIANCPPDHITARSIAYIRTKMTRLRNDSIPSGHTGLKQREVLHESHSQSTDTPLVPPPSTPDGAGEIFRVSRFCERLVQQDTRKIHDNSVIAECFELVPDGQPGSVSENSTQFIRDRDRMDDREDIDPCCPKKCCSDKTKAEESLSDMTFFTEEDAASLQELVDHMSFGTKKFPPSVARKNLKNDNPTGEQHGVKRWRMPQPSGKHVTKNRSSKTFKNSSSSPRQSTMKSKRKPKSVVRGGIKVLPDLVQKEFIDKKKRISRERKRKVTFNEHPSTQDRKHKSSKTRTRTDKRSKPIHNKRKYISYRRSNGMKKPFKKPVPPPSTRSNVFYDAVADSLTESYEDPHLSESLRRTSLPRKAPFKGFKVKLSVFACLVLMQIAEIYFITAFPMVGNKFFITNSDGSSGEGAARMASAMISSLIALIWYPLFTVHLIALLSYFIEFIRKKISADNDSLHEAESGSEIY